MLATPTKLVLLNGPPRVGKDTAAVLLLQEFRDARKVKMTVAMDRAIQAMFNLSDSEFTRLREAEKDQPQELFGGRSMRQVLISLSEDWSKPQFGKAVFGRLLATRFLPLAPLLVCSDSGFVEEVAPFIPQLGAENVLLIRLHRNGCSFDGDSRSYITFYGSGPVELDVQNNGTPEQLRTAVVDAVANWRFANELR